MHVGRTLLVGEIDRAHVEPDRDGLVPLFKARSWANMIAFAAVHVSSEVRLTKRPGFASWAEDGAGPNANADIMRTTVRAVAMIFRMVTSLSELSLK